MAFKDKLQDLLQKISERREGQPSQPLSNRPNGGMSGYQPKIPKRQPVQEAPQEHPAAAFASMAPMGVDASSMPRFQQTGTFQHFATAQQAMVQNGAQNVNQQPAQPMQQPMAQPVQSQPMPQARFTGTGRQRAAQQPAQPQSMQNANYQPRHQAPQQTYPPQPVQQGFTFRQNAQPVGAPQAAAAPQSGAPQPVRQGFTVRQNAPMAGMPQQPAPQGFTQQQPKPAQRQGEQNVVFFPGTFVGEEGSAYKMVLRVAQITGVPSCYRLIEFMQNSEAMIVNAEQISDVMEADRCMDLLFGAAYAMNQSFVRISGKMIYLIVPKQIQVEPFDGLLRMSNEDIERRWPGANVHNQPEHAPFGGFAPQSRQDDFAPRYGARAARNPQAGVYTDFGGYSARR